MRKNLKTKIFVGVICCLTFYVKAQNPYSIVKSEGDNGNKTYVAQNNILFLPGYEYNDGQSKLHGYIDKETGYQSLFTDESFDLQTINTNLTVGSTPGEFTVSETGGSGYSIPIQIPQGTSGMEPNLSLEYNNQNGNGILGMGWSFTGSSSISLCQSTFYHEDETENVELDGNDKFAMDGMRLISTGGVYGANGTFYSTEVESYVRITSFGSGATPDWFKVETKDGLTMEFGRSDDSKITGQNGKGVLWYLNKIYDTYENYVEFKYWKENGEHRLEKVLFTGNNSQGITPYNIIKFKYSKREDKNSNYIAGIEIKADHLLDRIEIFSDGLLFKSYSFEYGYNLHSYLNSITESGANGEKLNSTLIKYGDPGLEIESFSCNTFNNIMADFQVSKDFNGDGKSDVLVNQFYYDSYGNKVYTTWEIFVPTSNNLFTHYASGIIPSGYYMFFDYNISDLKLSGLSTSLDFWGDGTDDILLVQTSGSTGNLTLDNLQIIDINGENNTSIYNPNISTGGFVVADKFLHIGDYNGDGRDDIFILRYPSNDNLTFYGKILTAQGAEQNVVLNGLAYLNSAHKILPSDFDGDGKEEIMVVYDNSCEIFEFKSQPINGNYHIQRIYYSGSPGYPTQWHTIIPGDFNGDGKTDILTSGNNIDWSIGYSNGIYFQEKAFTFQVNPDLSSSSHGLKIGDYNGDGKTDILHAYSVWNNNSASSSKIDLYYCNGFAFEYESHLTGLITNYDNFSVGDFNGDGKSDLFNRDLTSQPADIHYFNRNSTDYYARKIKDGFGNVIEFEYSWLSQSDSYSVGNIEVFPINDKSFALPIVISTSVSDGIGGEDLTSYKYKGAKWHRQGAGFLGFEQTITENNITDIRIISENEIYNDPFIPKLKLVIPKLIKSELMGNMQQVSATLFTYSVISISGVHIKANQTNIINNDFISDVIITTNYLYDNYGNIVNSEVSNGVETETINYIYSNFGNWWIPSKVASESRILLRNGEVPYARLKHYSYNFNGRLYQEIMDPNLSNIITGTYQYDQFGNKISQIQSGTGVSQIVDQFKFDDKGRFVIEQINPAGQKTFFEIDKRWGKPLKITGPNGLNVFYEYDSFGFETSVYDDKGKVTTIEKGWEISNGGMLPQPQNTLFYEKKSTSGQPSKTNYFDIFGRDVKMVSEGLSGEINAIKQYDSKGNITITSNSFYNGEAPIFSITSYDVFNRKIDLTTGNNSKTWTYNVINSETHTTISGSDQTSSTISDASGKVISSTDAGGSLIFKYFSNGQQKQVELDGNILVSATYDEYGNQIAITDMNSGTITYEYNAYGQLISQTNANDETHTILYDNFNREVGHDIQQGDLIEISYVNELEGLNKVKKYTSQNGSKEFEYDQYGRTIKEKTTIDGIIYESQFEFDNYDRITSITYPSNYKILLIYDQFGNVQSVAKEQGNEVYFTNPVANAKGQLIEYELGNGVVTYNTYNQYGIIESIYADGIQDYELEFDYLTGNILARIDNLKNRKELFEYDEQKRLVESKVVIADNPQLLFAPPLVVDYSPNGNIIYKSEVGEFNYDANKKNAVISVDNSSQLIPSIQQDIVYTSFDRVESISEGDNLLEFDYGPFRNRIKSELFSMGSLIEKHIYLDNYEEIEANGEIKKIHYIPLASGLGSTVVMVDDGFSQNAYYLYKDHLGTVASVTNENADIIFEQNFDPWGKERNPNDWTYDPIIPNNGADWIMGFTGHEQLDEFGLVNMNNRLYDPILGRMLSVDNYVQNQYNSQFYNRYSYVNNNPMGFADPSGEFIAPIIGLAAACSVWGGMHAKYKGYPIWLGAARGALVGASLGYGLVTLSAATNVAGATRGILPKLWDLLPRQGLSKTGAVLNIKNGSKAFYTVTNALLTAHVNMASYGIQTLVTGQTFDKNRFWLSGLTGLVAGTAGGLIAGYNQPGMTAGTLSLQNWSTAVLNGGLDRLATGVYNDDNPWTVVRNTLFGAAEGFMAGHIFDNEYLHSIDPKYGEIIGFGVATQFVTSVPGLASMAYSGYFPMWAGSEMLSGGTFARGLLGFMTVNTAMSAPASPFNANKAFNNDTWYFTQIGNFSLKPFGFFSMFQYFKY